MKNTELLDLVRNVLDTAYGLQPTDISPIHIGTRNKSFIISTPEKKYVLRIYAPNRAKDHIAFELDVMNLLNEKGLPVPHIIPVADKQLIATILLGGQERNVILMDFMEGRPLSSKDINMLVPLASLQAKMHVILKDAIVPRKKSAEVLLNWSRWSSKERERMKPILGLYNVEKQYLEMLDAVRDRMTVLSDKLEQIPYAECHNDLFGENILIKDGEISAVLDFDNLTASPLIFDVANTIFSWLFHSYPSFDTTFISQYIKAYESERKLSSTELELLVPLIAMRNFAITNSLYTHAFITGRERIDKTISFHRDVMSQLLSDL